MAGMSVHESDMIELRSMNTPPALVKATLEAFLLLLGYPSFKADNWKFIRKVLGRNSPLLDLVVAYDCRAVSPVTANAAKQLVRSFSVEHARNTAASLAGIFLWVQKAIEDLETYYGAEGDT